MREIKRMSEKKRQQIRKEMDRQDAIAHAAWEREKEIKELKASIKKMEKERRMAARNVEQQEILEALKILLPVMRKQHLAYSLVRMVEAIIAKWEGRGEV